MYIWGHVITALIGLPVYSPVFGTEDLLLSGLKQTCEHYSIRILVLLRFKLEKNVTLPVISVSCRTNASFQKVAEEENNKIWVTGEDKSPAPQYLKFKPHQFGLLRHPTSLTS